MHSALPCESSYQAISAGTMSPCLCPPSWLRLGCRSHSSSLLWRLWRAHGLRRTCSRLLGPSGLYRSDQCCSSGWSFLRLSHRTCNSRLYRFRPSRLRFLPGLQDHSTASRRGDRCQGRLLVGESCWSVASRSAQDWDLRGCRKSCRWQLLQQGSS